MSPVQTVHMNCCPPCCIFRLWKRGLPRKLFLIELSLDRQGAAEGEPGGSNCSVSPVCLSASCLLLTRPSLGEAKGELESWEGAGEGRPKLTRLDPLGCRRRLLKHNSVQQRAGDDCIIAILSGVRCYYGV